MKAMILKCSGTPLQMEELTLSHSQTDQFLVKVTGCGVCRTGPHVTEVDLSEAARPIIPGHEIVGHTVDLGRDVKRPKIGDKVSIWNR